MECSTGKKVIYLDNNATTLMPQQVVERMIEWINKGNPSADYKSANDCKQMMKKFRCAIATSCGFDSYECMGEGNDKASIPIDSSRILKDSHIYHVIFTSCGSESNNMILRSVTESYKLSTGKTPHIIISSIEHKSLLNCAMQLAKHGHAELSLIRPDKFGFIHPEDVAANIRPNTAIISIMYANNETGAINNIKAIGTIAKKHKIVMHTDCVQRFGKFLINPLDDCVDAFSVSFHKLHGPAGVGAIVIKKSVIDSMGLEPEICGSQNGGMRGGTENMPGIAAAFEGFVFTKAARQSKNKALVEHKKHVMQQLSKYVPCRTYKEYLIDCNIPASEAHPKKSLEVIFLSTCEPKYLPNTLLLSVVKRTGDPICNGKMKAALEKKGIIVSIGSACNTASPKASHVISEMGVDDLIKKGTIRVSFGDDTTKCDTDIFVAEFLRILKNAAEGKAY